MSDDGNDADPPGTADAGDDVAASYEEAERERRIVYEPAGRGAPRVTVAAPTEGYGMLIVRRGGAEVERYYGLDMALDHAAELLGVSPRVLPVPDAAEDMGM